MTSESMNWFAKGALVGVLGSPPLAALSALLFRFPVPFAGYMSGAGAMFPAIVGSLFYGLVFGGFAVQAALGGLGGLTGAHYGWPERRQMQRLCVLFSLIGAAVGILTLAVLDKIIGPW